MSDNRKKLLERIKALLSKTVENGCTEAEAMSALSMAQSMMDAYEVTAEDLAETEKESAIRETMKDMRDPHHIRAYITRAIGKFTNTKSYRHEFKSQKWKYHFIGLQSDVEFAVWLTETLTMFVQKELKNYIWANHYTSLEPSHKRRIINGFVIGCTNRITERLNALSEQAVPTANGTALMVIKDQLINRKMQELGLELRQPRARSSRINDNSYEAGQAAGNRATFGRPVGGEGGIKLIGGR